MSCILVKPRIVDVEGSVFKESLADRDMDSLRICLFAGFVLKFMAVLVPYGDIDLLSIIASLFLLDIFVL